jgi:putative membrane protein (TIGR04086 family)
VRSPVPASNGTQIRWSAAATGFLVDFTISSLIVVFANPGEAFFSQPTLANPVHLLFFALFVFSTGIGGYVAGRIAARNPVLHGLLVGVFGVLLSQISIMSGAPNPPVAFVVASAIGCGLGAIGGLVSQYVPPIPR